MSEVNVGTLIAILKLEDHLSTELEKVSQRLDGLEDDASKAGASVGAFERAMTMAATVGTFLGNALYDLASRGVQFLWQEFQHAIELSTQATSAFMGLSSVARAFGVDVDAARSAAQSLASDGLMKVSESALGLKNLLASGFNLDQAVQLMNAFKDSAAFGRQASLEFGYAVVSATEGIKNQNSILVDNAGVTKNLSIILKEAGFSVEDLARVSSDASVRLALLNGILQETAAQAGDAQRLTETYTGQVSRLTTQHDLLLQTLGAAITENKTVATVIGIVADEVKGLNNDLVNQGKAFELVSDVVIGFVRGLSLLVEGMNFIAQAFLYAGTFVQSFMYGTALAGQSIDGFLLSVMKGVAAIPGATTIYTGLSASIQQLQYDYDLSGAKAHFYGEALDESGVRAQSLSDFSHSLSARLDEVAGQLDKTRGQTIEFGEATDRTRQKTGGFNEELEKTIATTDKLRQELIRLEFEGSGALGDSVRALGSPMGDLELRMLDAAIAAETLREELLNIELYAPPVSDAVGKMGSAWGDAELAILKLRGEANNDEIERALKLKEEAIKGLASSFENLGSTIGGATGNVVDGLGQMFTKFADMGGASTEFMAKSSAVVQGITAVWQATDEGGAAMSALSGAASGFMAGLAFGPWGAAAGAAIGAVTGLLRGMGREAEEDAEKLRAGQEMFEEWVDETAHFFDENATAYEKARVGTDDLAKAQFVLSEAFADLGLNALEATHLLGLLERAQAGGPEAVALVLDEINDLLEEHARIMEDWAAGVTTFAEGLNTFADGFGLRMEKVIDLQKSGVAGTQELRDETLLLQQQFDALGEHTVQAFGVVFMQTGSLMAALDAIGPSLDALVKAQEAFGFESGAAVDKLLHIRDVVDANQDVFTSLEGLVLMMEGLSKATLLTKADLELFGHDALTAFDTLISRGIPAQEAMALMQPTLQALWEAQQKFGKFTDETTQALIDQAEAAGLVGADSKDIFEQILDVLGLMVDAIERIPDAFAAALAGAKLFGDELDRLSRIPGPNAVYTGGVAVPRDGSTTTPTTPGTATPTVPGSTTPPPGGAVPRGSVPPPGNQLSDPYGVVTGGGGTLGGIYIAKVCISIGSTNNPNYDGDAAAMAFLRKLEGGGDLASLYRRIHGQLVDPCECD